MEPSSDNSPQFPIPPRDFDGASRTVDAGACFEWLRQGWALFMGNPGVWIACAALVLVALAVLSAVHLAGGLVLSLLTPVLGAGLLQLCRRQSEGATPEVADLFIGFKQRTGDLVIVGLVFALALFAIFVVVGLVVGGGMLGGMAAGAMGGHMVGFGLMLGAMLMGFLLVALFSMPISMAVWFAPALVFFNGMQPIPAMKASFHACLKNWLAFLVYGLMLFVLSLLASMTLGLGLLVLIPVLSGALYASYRDIFVGV